MEQYFQKGIKFQFRGDNNIYEVIGVETINNVVLVRYNFEDKKYLKPQVFKPTHMRNEYKFL